MKIFAVLACFLFLISGCGYLDDIQVQEDMRIRNETAIENEINRRATIEETIIAIETDLRETKDIGAREALVKVLDGLHRKRQDTYYHEDRARKQVNLARERLGMKLLKKSEGDAR